MSKHLVSDKTALMGRLVQTFAVRICYNGSFLMMWFNLFQFYTKSERFNLEYCRIETMCEIVCEFYHWRRAVIKASLTSACMDNVCLNSFMSVKLHDSNTEHWWLVYFGWFKLVFESLGNSSRSLRKQIHMYLGIFWGNFLILSWKCMCCVLIRIASMRWFWWVHSTYSYFIKDWKVIPKLYASVSRPGAMINPQRLKLPKQILWSQRCLSHWSYTVVDLSQFSLQIYYIYYGSGLMTYQPLKDIWIKKMF